jgi:hypothetical protein
MCGCLLGSGWAVVKTGLGRPYPGILLNSIGTNTIVVGSVLGLMRTLVEARMTPDIHTILKQDNVPISRRTLYERTTEWCEDDSGIFGAAVGLASSVFSWRALRPPYATIRFGLRRAIGGMSLGWFAGTVLFNVLYGQQIRAASEKYNEELRRAEQLWVQRLGKAGHPLLYKRFRLVEQAMGSEKPLGSMQFPMPFHGEPSDFEDDQIQSNTVVMQPPGSHPHACVVADGKIQYMGNRDYFWQPASSAEGLETLQNHIEDLKDQRSKLHRQAEFLFHEIAARESQYERRDKTVDTEASRKERKALELLSSMHFNLWSDISVMDWLITDSQKMILQMKSNGTWLPEKTGNPTAYAPDTLLEKIREHKQKTEMLVSQLESVIAPSEDQKQLDDHIREMKENDSATGDLIQDFEERRGPGTSIS